MNIEEKRKLEDLVQNCFYPYLSNGGEERWQADDEQIVEYVDTLLAAKDAAIAELEAINERQTQTIAMLKNAPNLFRDVMTASLAYVTRFPGGRLTEEGTVKKFDEEVDEFKEEITELVIFNDEARSHLLEEFIDVMVTAGGIFAYYGIKWSEIERAACEKLKKLTERTTDTHVWHEETKTVIRKSKLEAQS